MPHIIYKKKDILNTPSTIDGVDFKFTAKSYNFTNKTRNTEYKIAVNNENRDFLLSIKPKDENLMVKFDKVTRVSPVSTIKDALNAYIKAIDADTVFSNTSNISNKTKLKSQYLKDIDFFVNSFETTKEIQIEVGFGSGRHLIHQAKNNPETQFIGLEIHTPSIEQLLKQLEIQEIKNVLVVNYDARLFMEFIQSNKVGRVFVHFPVPWDKKPHRRVYSSEFVNESLRVLKPMGTLELRTDSRKYFDYSLELLTNLPKGKITIDINKDLDVSSKYEDRWKKQGKNIYDVILQANSTDEQKNIISDFSFDFTVDDFNKTISNLPIKSVVEDDYFVHIENVFIIENRENSGLIEITMGNFDRPVSKYLLIKDGSISYYQGNPIPTSSNLKAHQKIEEILRND
ncbi:MAG: tRNA (guanosine(46)-N7)-methyltransferase TrmB [Campylobacterota bacterium]